MSAITIVDSPEVANETIRPRRALSPQLLEQVDQALTLFENALTGNYLHMARFKEAMSRSDFQYLLGTAMDRTLLQAYEQAPAVWQQFAGRTTVNDFKPKKMDDLLGGMSELPEVAELAPYTSTDVSDAEYSLSVTKRGKKIGISWETMINDDLDALRALPGRLIHAARNTESKAATQLLADAAGPHATFFSSGNANKVSGNPVLGLTGLIAALTLLASKTDVDGNPIVITSAVLVVPPALEATAHNILNATEVRAATGGGDGTGNDQITVRGNGLPRALTLCVNPWLPVVDQSANKDKGWYIVPAPNQSRPALTLGFLRGHEAPDLRVKGDAGQYVGGGAVGATEGSFDNDDIQWRVRHVLGSSHLDPKLAVASSGAGS